MNRWYDLLEPIQGFWVKNGATHIVHLPVGASVQLARPCRYRNVAEVEHNGAIIIVFYDDLRRRSRVRKETKRG